jgi:hypothetical protein
MIAKKKKIKNLEVVKEYINKKIEECFLRVGIGVILDWFF